MNDVFVMPPIYLIMAIISAALVGGLLASPILSMLIRLKSRQTVSQYVPEHAAKQGTPTMGGLILIAGFLGGMAYTFLQLRDLPPTSGRRYYLALIALFIAYAAIGFVDDFVVPRLMKGKRGLGWTQKLALQICCAFLMPVLLGRHMSTAQFGEGMFLILFFSNAYNFSDGMDALAGSLLVAICLGLTAVAATRYECGLYPVFGALIGGALPFLWLNRPPAKVFMGDVGSLPVGAVLGATVSALTMPAWAVDFSHSQSGTPNFDLGVAIPLSAPVVIGLVLISIVMVAELVPVPLQILSVKLRKKRLFPCTPIHHAFQKAGWPEKRVVGLFVGIQVLACIVGGAWAYSSRPVLDPHVLQSQEIRLGSPPISR